MHHSEVKWMLKLERVSKYYFSGNNVVQALRRINLECKIGEFIAITGESGSGKSTLLNVLSGLDTYEEGKLFFNNQDISHYTIEELEHYRKDYIGYVFQEYNIIDSYTVYQNIELALTIQGYGKEDKHQRVLELIKQVGLSHVAKQKASKLSGGEKQRTVIARTLAKDYQVLVCDEPTGNLNEEASRGIFELLRAISKDKLVIVITHDITLLQEYATRKVRLYDGEIVEDSVIQYPKESIIQEIQPKLSNTSFGGSLKLALSNITSVPKKSLFSLLTVIFMLATIFFVYSAGVLEMNKPYSTTNPYFTNADPSRIILVKEDGTQFTPAELLELSELKYVRDVFGYDMVFDTVLMSKKFNTEELWNEFYYFKPLPAVALDESDLLEGSLPQSSYEVVIGDHGIYQIGDEISLANSYLLSPMQNLLTDQFEFVVVGIVDEPTELDDEIHYFYLTNSGLERISGTSIYENSEIEIKISGTKKYDMATDTWITPEEDETVSVGNGSYLLPYTTWVEIDYDLENGTILTFDMMFYDICRDFDFRKEIRDDMDAGLCNANDFIQSHEITYRAITPFENNKEFQSITFISTPYTSDDQSMKLYMNQNTFDQYFSEKNYQITLIVKDTFEGNQVVKEVENLGYNVFYPSQIIDSSQAFNVVIRNVLITVIVSVIIGAIFFVGYFVLKNVVFSKLKDYLIIRSIGTSKKTVKRILSAEVFYVTILSIILILGFLLISEFYIHQIPKILRYYRWYDYLVLLGLVFFVMEAMVLQFTSKIFKVSVVTALKGVER